MAKINWSTVIDQLQAALVWAVIGVLVFCTLVLLAFDSLAGAGVGMNLTRGNVTASVVISLATTGLLTSVAFLAYLASKNNLEGVSKALIVVSVIFLGIDIYLDSLGADILHYGAIVAIKNLQATEQGVHFIYRVLIGGLSTVGEPLALAIITGMPVLKEIINNAIPVSQRMYQPQQKPPQQPRSFPSSIPTRQQ
jgi:hypothetical protein